MRLVPSDFETESRTLTDLLNRQPLTHLIFRLLNKTVRGQP